MPSLATAVPIDEVVTRASCVLCDQEIDPDWDHRCETCQGWRCRECGQCIHTEGRVRQWDTRVQAYSYRPRRYRPRGSYRAAPLMGVELEVGGDQHRIADVVADVDAGADHLYLKRDMSIDGVEIVTHPMTLTWARRFPFPEMLRRLERGCFVDGGDKEYGLHVHVARNAFRRDGKQSAAHQMLWLLFMYRNSAELEKLARRKSDRWARFGQPMPGELARKAKVVECNDRYVAVNCNNKKTYELRFFKSTLNVQEFYAALEFADASVRYTRDVNVRDVLHGKAITWPHFAAWVAQRKYPNLLAEMNRSV
ncbi:amidoligase enzyme [Mycobacteroides abscessus]|nr:amidoligase enzyme [Mycobacteroides abscessus]